MGGYIAFEKVNLENLSDSKTYVDMHAHSEYSFDSRAKISAIAQKMRKYKFGIALADHDEIRGNLALSKYKDLMVIPAIEVRCDRGFHTLLYFYDRNELVEYFKKYVAPCNTTRKYPTILEQLDSANQYNCIKIMAHPFAPGPTAIMSRIHRDHITHEVTKKFCGVEIMQGCNLKQGNRKALALQKALKLMYTGGSDGHTVAEQGSTLTYTDSIHNVEEFLDAIRNKENKVFGVGRPTVTSTLAHMAKVPAIVANTPTYIEQIKTVVRGKWE